MSVPARLAAFAVAAALALAGGAALGAAVGPIDEPRSPHHPGHSAASVSTTSSRPEHVRMWVDGR